MPQGTKRNREPSMEDLARLADKHLAEQQEREWREWYDHYNHDQSTRLQNTSSYDVNQSGESIKITLQGLDYFLASCNHQNNCTPRSSSTASSAQSELDAIFALGTNVEESYAKIVVHRPIAKHAQNRYTCSINCFIELNFASPAQ